MMNHTRQPQSRHHSRHVLGENTKYLLHNYLSLSYIHTRQGKACLTSIWGERAVTSQNFTSAELFSGSSKGFCAPVGTKQGACISIERYK